MSTIAGQIVSGSVGSATTIGPFRPPGGLRPFNVFISGTFVGTVELQRSYDGTNYTTVTPPELNAVAAFTYPTTFYIVEPDPACLYQLNVTEWTSGTINGRMG